MGDHGAEAPRLPSGGGPSLRKARTPSPPPGSRAVPHGTPDLWAVHVDGSFSQGEGRLPLSPAFGRCGAKKHGGLLSGLKTEVSDRLNRLRRCGMNEIHTLLTLYAACFIGVPVLTGILYILTAD